MSLSSAAGISEPLERRNPKSILEAERRSIEQCGHRLLTAAGKTGKGTSDLPALYIRNSKNQSKEFLEYMLSVMYVESRFNRTAISDAGAYGLMQLTMPAIEQSILECKLAPTHTVEQLFDSVTNVRFGSCYLNHVLEEAEGNWTRALILYNGGYRALTIYDKGDILNTETANYVLQVERALTTICRVTNSGVNSNANQ